MEANVEVAQIYENTGDARTSLVYYEKAVKIGKSRVEERKQKGLDEDGKFEDNFVAPELLINVGTLSLEVGKDKEAMEAFEETLQICNKLLEHYPDGEFNQKLYAMKITARFNIGCALES
jgi:tetratricopeptide (TPR) repeat protein